MARKREVLPPTTPLLCDHITLQSKWPPMKPIMYYWLFMVFY